jgi:hypothetical protein
MAQLNKFQILVQRFRHQLTKHSHIFRIVAGLVNRRIQLHPLKQYSPAWFDCTCFVSCTYPIITPHIYLIKRQGSRQQRQKIFKYKMERLHCARDCRHIAIPVVTKTYHLAVVH